MEAKLKEKHKEELDKVDDIEELILDGITTLEKISESDKKYLERFSNLSLLSMNLLGLTSVENMPIIPSIHTVSLLLSITSSSLTTTR